jgi:hypothetical protein
MPNQDGRDQSTAIHAPGCCGLVAECRGDPTLLARAGCCDFVSAAIRSTAMLRFWDAAPNNLACLKFAEQNEDQHDNQDETKSAPAVVSHAIERTTAETAEAPKQRDN